MTGNKYWMQCNHEQRRLAMDLRTGYANATPYDYCTHGDYPAHCVTCLTDCAITVLNNTPEFVQARIAGYLDTAVARAS